MVTQEEHKIYPDSGRELRNTLCPASLWIVLICDDQMFFWGRSLPALYNPGGKVTDLRNLIPTDYNSYIRRGYDINPNRLGFLDR
jgi:hypothetical protein